MKIKTAIAALFLLFVSLPAWAQSPTFVTTAMGPVGTPIPVTVYLSGSPVAPSTITWTGPASVTCSPNGSNFLCVSNTVGTYAMKATYMSGTYATLMLSFTPGLQFVIQ